MGQEYLLLKDEWNTGALKVKGSLTPIPLTADPSRNA
jgi:hypothetical protein